MKKYFEDNTPTDIEILRKSFSNQRLFAPLQDAIEKANKHGQPRHFLKDGETVLVGSEQYAISNQWGVGNIEDFINDMRKLGYQIDES